MVLGEESMQEQAKLSEIIILCIVSAMALGANLPDGLLGDIIDHKLLLMTLTISVVIALFHYLRLMLFVTISILAIGANLPEELATQLNVSPTIMLSCLAMLVSVSVVNHLLKLMPTEKIAARKLDSPESRHAVLTAIMKGDLVTLHQLLRMDVEINFMHNGTAPIFLATEKGYADIVLILLSHGAKFRVKNPEGKTPMEIALSHKYTRIAEILHYAAEQKLPIGESGLEPSTGKRLFQRDSTGRWTVLIPFINCYISNK
jgi:hypothetical protein